MAISSKNAKRLPSATTAPARLNQLRKEVDLGAEQIERGQYTDYDVENLQPLVDEIQVEGRKRLAKRAGERSK